MSAASATITILMIIMTTIRSCQRPTSTMMIITIIIVITIIILISILILIIIVIRSCQRLVKASTMSLAAPPLTWGPCNSWSVDHHDDFDWNFWRFDDDDT